MRKLVGVFPAEPELLIFGRIKMMVRVNQRGLALPKRKAPRQRRNGSQPRLVPTKPAAARAICHSHSLENENDAKSTVTVPWRFSLSRSMPRLFRL